MAVSRISFHIQTVVKPKRLRAILGLMPEDHPIDVRSLHRRLIKDGIEINPKATQRNINMAKKLGLVEESESIYSLNILGQACRNLSRYRQEVFNDVIHFLFFSTWEKRCHQDHWSWTYAKICEILWYDSPTIQINREIFGRLSAEAARKFPELSPVVGTETVNVVRSWLGVLSPSFIILEAGKPCATKEREWFSVELALLGISYLYSVRDLTIATPLLLDQVTLGQLCPLCLASPNTIATMIDVVARTFPYVDIHTGEWGSSVVLRQPVEIPLIV